jgi:hypothetical protein
MHDLTYLHVLLQLVTLLELEVRPSLPAYPQHLVFYRAKAPPRQNEHMSSLRVAADHSINEVTGVVVYFEFLINLSETAAIKHGLLSDLANILFLVLDVDRWAILFTQTAVPLTNGLIRRVLIVILADNLPGTVGGR